MHEWYATAQENVQSVCFYTIYNIARADSQTCHLVSLCVALSCCLLLSHSRIRMRKHTHTHTHKHTPKHTHIHAHTHKHTHTLSLYLSLSLSLGHTHIHNYTHTHLVHYFPKNVEIDTAIPYLLSLSPSRSLLLSFSLSLYLSRCVDLAHARPPPLSFTRALPLSCSHLARYFLKHSLAARQRRHAVSQCSSASTSSTSLHNAKDAM